MSSKSFVTGERFSFIFLTVLRAFSMKRAASLSSSSVIPPLAVIVLSMDCPALIHLSHDSLLSLYDCGAADTMVCIFSCLMIANSEDICTMY